MASTDKRCSHCSAPTENACTGCFRAPPSYYEVSLRPTYYCARECQVADWDRHKATCRKLQTRKLLYRVVRLALTLLWFYEDVRDFLPVGKVERIGDVLWVTHDSNLMKHAFESGNIYYGRQEVSLIREALHMSEDLKSATIMGAPCATVNNFLWELIRDYMAGYISQVEGVEVYLKGNPLIQVSETTNGDLDLPEYVHDVLMVTLTSGEHYALDFLGNEYGFTEVIVDESVFFRSRTRYGWPRTRYNLPHPDEERFEQMKEAEDELMVLKNAAYRAARFQLQNTCRSALEANKVDSKALRSMNDSYFNALVSDLNDSLAKGQPKVRSDFNKALIDGYRSLMPDRVLTPTTPEQEDESTVHGIFLPKYVPHEDIKKIAAAKPDHKFWIHMTPDKCDNLQPLRHLPDNVVVIVAEDGAPYNEWRVLEETANALWSQILSRKMLGEDLDSDEEVSDNDHEVLDSSEEYPETENSSDSDFEPGRV